ncbi:siderophore-interacting protein [Paeniglutamicibacter sp. ZC-3]|uniref:siderophore-interacting protein n=1 Tax=Paeniglutamicibacter sp. ZC-3 TaxID=2986919 RepID=UPI0021F74A5E|nr:siderophore-interacting protein [Paeniglutamicibacter sp. ZC-3]MCV9993134.1 siderophore-interacting protein [Paeniglutamicibacter sp. ZC-3]
MSTQRSARPVRPQVVLEVLASERLSPHMMRLTFGGPGFVNFQDKAVSDRYVKILFAKPELGLVPPYDLDALREQQAPEDFPVRRTYTLRHVDLEAQTVQIDFVIHGDQGLAGPWAQNAKIGDQICFASPGGLYTPDPAFDRHLLIGDETALPAISAAVEDMTPDMVGDIYLEVSGPEDEVQLDVPAGVNLHWLHRGGYFTPENTKLEETVRNSDWHEGTVQVFAHGERETMKSLRAYLNGERGVDRKAMSLSAYWAYGRAEDEFQAEKKTPIGQIYPEAMNA